MVAMISGWAVQASESDENITTLLAIRDSETEIEIFNMDTETWEACENSALTPGATYRMHLYGSLDGWDGTVHIYSNEVEYIVTEVPDEEQEVEDNG